MERNQKTQFQLETVIILHCLTECNNAKLERPAYEAKLQAMLNERGITPSARLLIEIFQEA